MFICMRVHTCKYRYTMFTSHTATHAATHNATHTATKIQLCLYVYKFTYLLGWSGGVSKSSKHIAVVTEFLLQRVLQCLLQQVIKTHDRCD